jgi:Flp pilus assembly protein TadG
MRPASRKRQRMRVPKNPLARAGSHRGATAIEAAIVLSGLFVVLFGMLDLGLGILEFNTLAEASRRLCRQAIVHGQNASPSMTAWGPESVSGTAADSTAYAQALSPELATFNLSNVKYTINWPDDSNQYDSRVEVIVTYQYQPLMPFIFGTAGVPLQAVTTMHVEH